LRSLAALSAGTDFCPALQINLPRQTLARWVELGADWLQPIYEQIRTGAMAGGYVQVEETPIEYLALGHGQTKQGYLWTCCWPGKDVFYRWETSRAADCLRQGVGSEFKGVLSATAMVPIMRMPTAMRASNSRAAGRMPGASSTRRWSKHPGARTG
jgi:hypothetical protein